MVWSSNGRSVRRTVDLYDERQPLADTKPGGLRVGGKSCGSRSRRERHSGGSSARSQSRASCKHLTMDAACDQSRRPRCWPLGRGGLPVRGCSASASGYLQRRWRRRSTLPTLLWNERARLDTAPLPPQPDSRRSSVPATSIATTHAPACVAMGESAPRTASAARTAAVRGGAISAEGAAAVSQIVNGALPRVSTALLKVILVLPRPPPGEGQDSCPAFGRFHGSAMPKHTRGADGASRSTCGCPAPDCLVVVRRVAVNRSGQREDTLQRHVHMLWMTDGQD
jgi:hypothetical protein